MSKLQTFQAGKAEVPFLLSTNAIADIEELCGKGIMEVAQGFTVGKVTFTDLRIVIFCGVQSAKLKLQEPFGMTLEDIGDLMDDAGGIATLLPLLGKAFGQAFPADKIREARKEMEGEEVDPTPPPIGTDSSEKPSLLESEAVSSGI